MHIFGKKLVSRTSKQFSRNLRPLWQPGVYNDTNCRTKLPRKVYEFKNETSHQKHHENSPEHFKLERGRIRFRRVRFQTPNSVSAVLLTKRRGGNSVSSFQPVTCVPKRSHLLFAVRRLTEFGAELSEFSFAKQYSSKQYSACFLLRPLWLFKNSHRHFPKTRHGHFKHT